MKCQCPETGVASSPMEGALTILSKLRGMASLYDPVTEEPYRAHAPGACQCKNNVRLYLKPDGEKLWLCSICTLSGDVDLNAASETETPDCTDG
jgi:hypothetical protein